MIADTANIPCAHIRGSSVSFWSADASGACFLTHLPKWQTVYWYFHKWRTDGYLSHCIEKLVIKIRRKRKQSATPSVMALDAQSVKWGNRQSGNGFDANKKGKRYKTQYCC